ncbi:MAG: phosphatase PAP2 family protein [Gemmatirosa sp.]|nr:phosphatase PAP2 family protein [Gemmatirosa sp.]
MASLRVRAALAAVVLLAAPATARRAEAQRDTATAPTTAPTTALVTTRDRITFAALVGAGAAVSPLDARIERGARGTGPQGSDALHTMARTFNAAGDPGALAASLVLFGAGRLAGSAATARLGLHAGTAIVLGGSATALVKLIAGRQRPNVLSGDADDFAPGHGYHAGRSSFPSGHTTAAFAFASAVATDVRATHPHAARVATPLLYGAATLVGAARVYDDKHWASDVAVGAAVGTLAGRVTTAYARRHPHGWLERLAH